MLTSIRCKNYRTTTAPKSQSRFRPCIQALEDRCLLSGGVLDPTFGNGGLVSTAIGSLAASYAVATYPAEGTANDGKVVAAGQVEVTTHNHTTQYAAVVRYNLDGSLDTSFGGTGEVLTVKGFAMGVAVQADGKVVVAGGSGGNFEAVRYNADGTLDASFGSGGVAATTITSGGAALIETMAIQPDGKIVLAGSNNPKNTTYHDLALVRFNVNGTLDSSFGSGGIVTTRLPTPVSPEIRPREVNLAIDPNTNPSDPNNGKIVVTAAGEVVRYNSNGSLDATFGTLGTGYESVSNLALPGVAGQSDDRIVLAGTASDAHGNQEIGVDRLNPDGTMDTSFGTGGVVLTPLPTGGAFTRAVAIQANGQILVAAVTDDDGGTPPAQPEAFLLARYNANGGLDTTFGTNGIAMGGTKVILEAEGVALEPDGRIVMAGRSVSGFSLARFLAAGPQIGSLTASPNPVTAGSILTLSVSNITDANPGATITQVAFYVQLNGTSTLLGYGTQTSPGVWSLTTTVNLASGTYTVSAQAEDSYGVFGDPFALTLTAQ
jgi:uncharacterized delta-60 repeat protein